MTIGLDRKSDTWLTEFASRVNGPAAGDPWLAGTRAAALAAFRKTGFPTPRDEDWRFTNVEPIARTAYTVAPDVDVDADVERSVAAAASGLSRGPRLVFLNGRLSPELSRQAELPAGVRLSSLRETFSADATLLKTHLGRQIEIDRHPFAALNSALWEDGACLHLAAGSVVDDPILLVFLSSFDGVGAAMINPRVLILADARSQATIVECYGALPSAAGAQDVSRWPFTLSSLPGHGGASFTNAVSEVVLGEAAVIDHLKMQGESLAVHHVSTTTARLSRDSRYASRSISAGGAIVRNDLVAVLDGEGAECILDGLFVAAGTQHVDNHTTIDHAKPHGTSRETYKGILGGRARGVFDGKIIVRADAQKTDSRQVNRNLLLSDAALINTKPQLEINADDVKCAHAATIGRLDEASLFYLRSRGLGHDEARALLIEAFAGEVVGRIALDPLRMRVANLVRDLAESESSSRIGEAA